ncbi:MAG: sigma-E processing peptidase SpoIIGA [Clostridia bacterium]|nr:sigma-E processing peptidase SpoIIGA [Clostridia bacterium]
MVVYADVLFLVNFAADFIAIYASAKILNVKKSYLRFTLAAFVGGAYGVAAIYMQTAYKWLFSAFFMIIMCLIAFGKKTVKENLKANFVFASVNMLLAGIMYFIYETAYKYKVYKRTDVSLKPIAAAVFFFISFVVVRIFQRILKNRADKSEITGIIGIMGKNAKFEFLCDSGNVFKDAYTDMPVIVISCAKAREKMDFENLIGIMKTDAQTAVKYKFRYVSVSTVAGSTVMPALLPDKTEVEKDGKTYEIKALVALDGSTEQGYNGKDGIIPYSVLQI